MNAWWQTLQPWAAVIVPTLLHFLWQGALLALIGGVITVACRRSSPTTRYAVFLGLFALMAVTPLITATVVMQGVPLALPVSSPQMETAPIASMHWQSQWHTEEAVNQLTAWQPFVLLVWMTGVVLCSLRLTGGLVWYVWLTRRLEPIPHELADVVGRLSQRLGLSMRVRIMLSHDVREPLAMRIIQPLIVLPASWLLSAPPLVVEAVLAHELAHIRRHDLWVNLLQRVVEMLLFFHPAVWWLSRQIRRERELCCDALAVAATGRAVEYAQALEAVARYRLAWSSPAMAAGMGGDRMALLERVRRVLGLETASDAGWWSVGLVGLLIAAVCWASVSLTANIAQGDEPAKLKTTIRLNDDDDEDDDDDEEMEDEDDEDENENRPRPPRAENREGERRDPPRGEGDRRPTEPRREGDRPRNGERPVEPRREGDRRPEERPRAEGERGPQPKEAEWARQREIRRDGMPVPRPDGDVMHELLATIRELRQEVQMLREEVRSIRRPGDASREGNPFGDRRDIIEGRGPQPDGRPGRNADTRPREDGRRDEGSRPREGSRDSRPGPDGKPRDADRRPDAVPRPEGAPRSGRDVDPERAEGRADETKPRAEPEVKTTKPVGF